MVRTLQVWTYRISYWARRTSLSRFTNWTLWKKNTGKLEIQFLGVPIVVVIRGERAEAWLRKGLNLCPNCEVLNYDTRLALKYESIGTRNFSAIVALFPALFYIMLHLETVLANWLFLSIVLFFTTIPYLSTIYSRRSSISRRSLNIQTKNQIIYSLTTLQIDKPDFKQNRHKQKNKLEIDEHVQDNRALYKHQPVSHYLLGSHPLLVFPGHPKQSNVRVYSV